MRQVKFRTIGYLLRAGATLLGIVAITLTGLSASAAHSSSHQFPANSSPPLVGDTCEGNLDMSELPEFVDDPEAIDVASEALEEIRGNPELGDPQVSQTDDSLVVAWPLGSNGFDEGSSFSVALSLDDYEVRGTSQSKIETIDESSVHLSVWTDGELQSEDIVESGDESFGVASTSSSTTNCIISATGLAPATALAIVSACSAGCVVTAGMACAACVGMFTALGSASIMSCFGQANS